MIERHEAARELYRAEVERMYRCRAGHVRTELGDDAKVHAFTLVGRAKANTCYAWSQLVDGECQFRAVLKLGEIQSAHDAVGRVHT